MFTRRQPREVYRVYGEEEFFADDAPIGPEPPLAGEQVPTAVHQPVAAYQGEPTSEVFADDPHTPQHDAFPYEPQDTHEQWITPLAGHDSAGEEQYAALPRSPLIAAQPSRHSRVAAVAVLAAVLGLLIGVVAINALHSAHGKQPPQAAAEQHAPVSAAHTPTVTASPASPPSASSTARPPRVAARPHVPKRSFKPRPQPAKRPLPARRAQRSYRPAYHAPVYVSRPAPPAPSTPAPVTPPPPVVQTAPAVPASAPAERYVPPAASGGPEFGFEH